MTVWIVWQWDNGSQILARIYASESDAQAYAIAVGCPEYETTVIPYPVMGARS